MKAVIASLCEQVRVRDDGLLDIVGAGRDTAAVDHLPWKGTLPFALLAQFEAVDDRANLGLDVRVIRALDTAVVGGVEPGVLKHRRTAPLPDGAPPYIPFALELNVSLDVQGQHGVVVQTRTGERLAFVVFVVRFDT